VNIADALERDRWPVYVIEAGGDGLDTGRLYPGAIIPGAVTVVPGTEPPAWETARRLLEEP
jgi:hypothetical protein